MSSIFHTKTHLTERQESPVITRTGNFVHSVKDCTNQNFNVVIYYYSLENKGRFLRKLFQYCLERSNNAE